MAFLYVLYNSGSTSQVKSSPAHYYQVWHTLTMLLIC